MHVHVGRFHDRDHDIVIMKIADLISSILFKFAAKNMERNSKKCEKEEKAEKLKLKKVSCQQ